MTLDPAFQLIRDTVDEGKCRGRLPGERGGTIPPEAPGCGDIENQLPFTTNTLLLDRFHRRR
jgi:hypothetical protein